MATKAKKEPAEPASTPRRLNKAERALLDATRSSKPDATLTPDYGVDLIERNRRGDYT